MHTSDRTILRFITGGIGKIATLPASMIFANVEDEGLRKHRGPRPLESRDPERMTMIQGTAANYHGTRPVEGRDRVDLELDDDYFEPTILEGSPHQQLTLVLVNEGSSRHNFHIDGTDGTEGVDRDVMPGGKEEVHVVFPGMRGILFSCKYHANENMIGELHVQA